MTEQDCIEIKKAETEVNICFSQISKAKYKLMCAKEDFKNAKSDIKIMEGKLKFIREVVLVETQQKIKDMQKYYADLEKILNNVIDGFKNEK